MRRVSALVVGPVIPAHGRSESEVRLLSAWRCDGGWGEAAEENKDGRKRNGATAGNADDAGTCCGEGSADMFMQKGK